MISRERVSHVDTAWLRMDRPENLMQIVGVMIFVGRVDDDRPIVAELLLQPRMAVIPVSASLLHRKSVDERFAGPNA